ncbi:MAG: alpha/beta family hydrolase [Tistlia sp.]|uniref:alpha/beta family hydrolase n=1 Tax=Tistlia sp. TaxID=3057121 RepID=UPI0034A4E9F8
MNDAIPLLFDGPAEAPVTLVLAHGAGAGAETPFMTAFAEGLAARGRRVARFEFPYMARRRADGRKRPPDRAPVLLASWRGVVAQLGGPGRVVLGGKSMGGRMASLLAAELEAEGTPARGLVCLGYPFHPPGKPERPRTAHLAALATPGLILQGTRDPFGGEAEVAGYALAPGLRVHWLDDGDHDLKPRKASGRSEAQNRAEAIEAVERFLAAL